MHSPRFVPCWNSPKQRQVIYKFICMHLHTFQWTRILLESQQISFPLDLLILGSKNEYTISSKWKHSFAWTLWIFRYHFVFFICIHAFIPLNRTRFVLAAWNLNPSISSPCNLYALFPVEIALRRDTQNTRSFESVCWASNKTPSLLESQQIFFHPIFFLLGGNDN